MGEVPASARDAVLARAVSLSGESRDLLDIAALIGARVELKLLESVMSCRSSSVDELTASGLLVGDGGWLKFRHEIARLTVEQAIAAHRRGVLHARILAALQAQGCDDDARMAFHAEAAADGPAVLRYAPSAARRATELGSHREAAAQFERALRFAAETDPATAAELYDGLAYEVSLLDRLQDAADARQRALELWRAAGDQLREGDTMRRLSRTMGRLCRGREAVAAAEGAVSILEPLGPSTELAWAYAGLATQRLMDAERPAAIELALRAQAIAEDDRARAAQLWTELGCRYEAAMALLDATDEPALREALSLFTGLGASASARVTRQKMRRLGIHSIPAGPRTATRAHPLGLTQREREVLVLICDGCTNAEIAAQLFISAKTVDHHVSAVLAKLDAPTRSVAASRAARLGLAGATNS
jgi:DNA-binding CsgD family transcriptional regulator